MTRWTAEPEHAFESKVGRHAQPEEQAHCLWTKTAAALPPPSPQPEPAVLGLCPGRARSARPSRPVAPPALQKAPPVPLMYRPGRTYLL
jgi:hypothetical protein